jgi:hypothetical protein
MGALDTGGAPQYLAAGEDGGLGRSWATMAAAAVRRYSRNPLIRRRQELFDDLQYRVEKDYFAPTMAELAGANVTKAKPICRDYACRHEGGTVDLTALPPKMRTHTLRKKLVCTKCGLRRPELELIWDDGAA